MNIIDGREDWQKFPTVGSEAKAGDSVAFMGFNGHAFERRQAAQKGLVVGRIYTIKAVRAGYWLTEITLEGQDGIFNSVMFCPSDKAHAFLAMREDDA